MSEKVLLVGFACIEVCLFCKCYPKTEDTCHRVRHVVRRRGGNCSNATSTLSRLKVPCHLFTTFGNDEAAEWTKKDLVDLGVDITQCPKIEEPCPVSYLILSDETGSRTIFVWYPDNWKEPTFEDFLKLELNQYTWVHFEGRNETEIKKMIAHLRELNESREESERVTISVEIEKRRNTMYDLIPLGDVVIISKEFAWFDGLKSMEEVIQKYKNVVRPTATIVVPWGELGASAYLHDGTTFYQPSFPPEKVVDSVGAGDTFIAALITALSSKKTVQEATTFACQVAGAKVGIVGHDGLLDGIYGTTLL